MKKSLLTLVAIGALSAAAPALAQVGSITGNVDATVSAPLPDARETADAAAQTAERAAHQAHESAEKAAEDAERAAAQASQSAALSGEAEAGADATITAPGVNAGVETEMNVQSDRQRTASVNIDALAGLNTDELNAREAARLRAMPTRG